MDNRGFPTAAPIGEGKPGFPYQAINGTYPGVYYPGQEMAIPYGQYGPAADIQFNDQCAVPSQQAPSAPANLPYGFGAHPYMQHYRQQQAHIMQAAYSNAQAQHQGRVANPQQIADSIYNMAAHAYSYQQQNPQLPLQAAPNSYSPGGTGGRSALSVRTGHSPADSLHSPAGSTHSIGERPMLSPHVQSNAQIYNNYHQPSHHSTSRAQQQLTAPSINYYNNNNGHTTPAHPVATVNGCMNPEMDHRQSMERLAAISHSSDQFNHSRNVNSPASTTNKMITSQSQYYPTQAVTGNMPAPSTCQHSAKRASSQRQPKPCAERNAAVVSAEGIQPSLQTQCAVITNSPPGEPKSSTTAEENTATSSLASEPAPLDSVTKVVDLMEEQDVKPKDTAADSGIDSEQVDKDNDEERDTSTTSNKSENSPQPIKKSNNVDDEVDSIDHPADRVGQPISDHQQHDSDSDSVQGNAHPHSPSHNDSIHSPPSATAKDDTRQPEVVDSNPGEEVKSPLDTSSVLNSELDDSFRSNASQGDLSHSLTSSVTSKQSMGDESRLPPRKRKQQLSEHTEALMAPMPIKKRGRPSKEAIRLRGAAKQAELEQKMGDPSGGDNSATACNLAKEEKSSTASSKDGNSLKKPVHSGMLLHSPKLTFTHKSTKEESYADISFQNKSKEKKDSSSQLPFTQQMHSNKKSGSVQPRESNAVLVSPPRKPKASVSEMQKALMRVVSSDTSGEICFAGRRKRGRPPGSKNKKTKLLDYRARSNSASSSNKGQFPVNDPSYDSRPRHVNEMDIQPAGAVNNDTNTPSSPAALSQSHKLSSSVQKRVKSLHYKQFRKVSPKSNSGPADLKLPVSTDQWLCTFCHQISNYRNMGDLFGGYHIQPHTPLMAKVFSHRKTSDLRQQQVDSDGRPINELWFHERCIIWSPGVYMVGGKLYGVYEAVTAAFQTTCSLCKKKGAILGCFCKGCSQRYHIHCAESAECVLNEENFSMLCTKHKDTKIVLV